MHVVHQVCFSSVETGPRDKGYCMKLGNAVQIYLTDSLEE